MTLSTKDRITRIWDDLASIEIDDSRTYFREYRRLGDDFNGVRISCHYPRKIPEILVEIGSKHNITDFNFPSWIGMGISLVEIDTPRKGVLHVCLELKDSEYREVFTDVCTSLVEELMGNNTSEERLLNLSGFLSLWSDFFERYGMKSLGIERQQGLFGELSWLNKIISSGLPPLSSVQSWRGAEKNLVDFNFKDHAVEVKTTMTKEPHKVFISNERQLDESPFRSLHLYVLVLSHSNDKSNTLPQLVSKIRQELMDDHIAIRMFNRLLILAGYIDTNELAYSDGYLITEEHLFEVGDRFPRIISLPPGLGDLSYSLLLGACSTFSVSAENYLKEIRDEHIE